MTTRWATSNPVEVAQRLIASLQLDEGRGRIHQFMADVMVLLAPELPICRTTTWHLDPLAFALVYGHTQNRTPADVRSAAQSLDHTDLSVPVEALSWPTDWPFFADSADELDIESSSRVPSTFDDALRTVFELLAAIDPTLSQALRSVTRRVVTFTGRQPLSFASMHAHGAVFLNWREGDGIVFATEEIAHQSGHVLLSTALFRREHEPFVRSPDTPLADLGITDDENRSVLVLFHAVVTEAFMTVALDGAARSGLVSNGDLHELRGRLLLTARRFGADLHHLCSRPILSASGMATINHCIEIFEQFARPALTVGDLDLTGQPYAFCRRTFFERNPTT